MNLELGMRAARISRVALDTVVAHARETAPDECCGLLLGSPASIVEAARTRNIADDPASRFLVDPKEHIDGRREARRRNLEVVGFYHSHPRSPAIPSATDLAEATYSGHLYLIVSLVEDPPEVNLFHLDDVANRSFLLVPFVISD